jgi:hypothetical protein
MTVLLVCISVIGSLAFVFWLSSLLAIWRDIKIAKRVYPTLATSKWYRNGDQLYRSAYDEPDDGFVWFIEDGSALLPEGLGIHPEIWKASLYGWIWLNKYRAYFATLDLNTLEKF